MGSNNCVLLRHNPGTRVGFKILTYQAPVQNWLESMNAVQGLRSILSNDITLIIDDPGLEQRCRGLIILVHSKLTVT